MKKTPKPCCRRQQTFNHQCSSLRSQNHSNSFCILHPEVSRAIAKIEGSRNFSIRVRANFLSGRQKCTKILLFLPAFHVNVELRVKLKQKSNQFIVGRNFLTGSQKNYSLVCNLFGKFLSSNSQMFLNISPPKAVTLAMIIGK